MKSPALLVSILALLVFSDPLRAGLVNRWSFNEAAGAAASGTQLTDSVSGAVAVVRSGTAANLQAQLTGTALTLPGTTTGNELPGNISAYLDLPNGLISSKTNLTVEFWATPHSVKTYQRLFDFGATNLSGGGTSAQRGAGAAPGEILSTATAIPGATAASDSIMLSVHRTALNTQRILGRLNGGTELYTDSNQTLADGIEYHFVVTFTDGVGAYGSNGGRLAWYLDGTLISTRDVGFHINSTSFNDVNNWLGRSQYSTDSNAHISYDEFRIYDHAMTPTEVASSFAAGPDMDPDPPLGVVPGLLHRWSFNTTQPGPVALGTELIDSVSGEIMTVRGTGATASGGQITLPGTTNGNQAASAISAYLDLPNGIISARTNLTLEIWATPRSVQNWMRVFDFGRVESGAGGGAAGEITETASAPGGTWASDDLMLSFAIGTNINQQRMESLIDGGEYTTVNTPIPSSLNSQYHYVFTFEDGVGIYGSSGGQMTWYRNGSVIGTGSVPFHLSQIEDVNNWLGRSQWTNDMNANASYNEVRIYDYAMTPAQVAANAVAGPNAVGQPAPEPSPVAPAQPVNRWSFDNPQGNAVSGTTIVDTIGGAAATVRGNEGYFTGSALTLPGTTTGNRSGGYISAYIDLPNGIVSSKPNFTAEFWVTPLGSPNWQRIFDVGRTDITFGPGAVTGEIIDSPLEGDLPGNSNGYDNLSLTFSQGTLLGNSQIEGEIGNGGPVYLFSDLSKRTSIGTEYHYVVTVEDNAGYYGTSGALARWYRDGVLHGVLHLNFHLSNMADVNNWIGRSMYTADDNSNMAVNEVRLYDRALTPSEIALSLKLGADAGFGPPNTNPDLATLQPGQKVLIPVLANDTGSINPGSVEVVSAPSVGTATVKSDGSILYAHSGSSTQPVTFTYRVYGLGGYTAPETVTVNVSNAFRISNSQIQMPSAAPASTWETVDALPGVTFNQPLCITSIPGNTQRLFVCERMAKIKLIPNVTAAQPTSSVFLDLDSVVANRTPVETIEGGANQEHGLLGLAFHPNYASNGYFYVAYTVRINGGSYYQRISRFNVSTGNPDVADPNSELILLEQLDEGSNHDGGDLHFGPDGYLYYAAGDEENPLDIRQNSQKIDKDFFTGIFRIDVDKKPGNLEPNPHAAIPTDSGIARFSVPADNPFIHTSLGGTWDGTLNGVAIADLTKVRTEFWAHGLRHVWRFSFDPLLGTLWAGDVGQDTYEEVNIVTKGGNYGWVYREGAHTTPNTNYTPPAGFNPIDPVYEYVHSNIAGGDPQFKGNSVCGGVVYRGSRFAGLYGAYIFCDSVSGHIWKRDGTTGVVTRLASVPGVYGGIAAIGIDPSNQDVLFADYLNGRILRLAGGVPSNSSFPLTLSATGLFADLTDLTPSPGLVPYDPNIPFWSDYAIKTRWFGTADPNSQMTWSRDGNWTFPTGMLWVKHFDMETTRGDPTTKLRLETRVLVKTNTGAYGVSYRWNDAQTEATLVPEEGVQFDFQVVENGVPRMQHWEIPGRSSCLTCHTPQGGNVLSFTTRQLNRSAVINGFVGNQLTLLNNAGYFTSAPEPPNTLPRHVRPDETTYPLETRVRSYLAVNCAYCHFEGGTGNGIWDGRAHLSLPETNLINGIAEANGGDPINNRLIVPGDTTHSIVYNRVAATNGFTRMPPLATSELDNVSITMLANWIAQLPARQTYDQWRQSKFGSSTSPIGDPTADPDGDGRTNMDEFLAMTDPLDGQSYLEAQFDLTANTVTVTFNVPPNRSVYVETSTDLSTWSRWDVPGNGGSPLAVGPMTLTGPSLGSQQFFRLQVEEN